MRRAALLGLALGCGSGGLLGKRVNTTKPGLTVPYIVGDPVANPPLRAALARTPWLVVDASGPALTGHYIVRANNSALFDQLRREVWGLKRPGLEFEEIDPAELEQLRIRPPTSHVWLVGPEGPCKATLGQPRVAGHTTVGDVIEVSYDLEGCVAAPWAPVGSLVEQLPRDVRWLEAEVVAEAVLGPDDRWDHAFAESTPWPVESEVRADSWEVRVRAVRDLDPVPAQTLATAVWHTGADRCESAATTAVGHLLSRSTGVDVQQPLPEVKTIPELLGAIVVGDSPEALVYTDRIDYFVAVLPASPDDRPDLPPEVDRGPPTWTAFTLETGPHSDAEFDAAAYRVQPTCEE